MERTFLTITNLEEVIRNYAQNRLNQTVPKIEIRGKHAGEQILKADLEVFLISNSEFRMNTCIIRGIFSKNLQTLLLIRRFGCKLCVQQPLSNHFATHELSWTSFKAVYNRKFLSLVSYLRFQQLFLLCICSLISSQL